MKKVIVITGLGGIGVACARRIGFGAKLVLGDYSQEALERVGTDLVNAGYDVTTAIIDVSDKKSVEGFCQTAAGLGTLSAIVHTAGVSPNMVDPARIMDINLIGTALVIETFSALVNANTTGIFISSNSGYLSRPLTKEEENAVATLSADKLKEDVRKWSIADSNEAYVLSKRANQLQIAVTAPRWGKNGGRIMSISPGIISTPMSKKEQKTSQQMAYMLQNSPVGRIGTPEDIASTVEFLLGSAGSFLTGSDILVDGGVTAFLRTRQYQ